ncbi:MAG: ATP-binding protein [Chloroflexi bacterium]|nr:ATP-binding protein [Chloroflexota bacterium]
MFRKSNERQSEPGAGERAVLFRVIPPKSGEFSAQGFINALEALNLVDEVLSLELCATDGRVRMYVRSTRPDHVLSALRSHYAHARFATVPPEDDPLLMSERNGIVCRQVLWPAGEQWLPFQVQDDTEDGDPFVDMLAGLSAKMAPGGRAVTRVLLSERDRDWSERWRNQAIAGSGSANQLAVDAMRREESGPGANGQNGDSSNTGGQMLQLLLIVIGMAALVAFVYLRHTFISIWDEHRVELFAYAALGLLALAGLGYLLHRTGIVSALLRSRFFRASPKPKFYDPDQVRLRVSGAAFRLEVQLYALLGDGRAGAEVLERVLRPVVASYRRFDSPMGARFAAGPLERLSGFDPGADDLGLLGGRKRFLRSTKVGQGVVGTREAAAFWHVPGDAVDVPGLARTGSRRLPVPQEMFAPEDGRLDGAALIGVEAYGDGGLRKLHIPAEAMHRSGLIVARTGMGKTTLTQHIARSLLRDRATGTGDAALVVVDPHSDLVMDILNGLPVGAAADVRLVDLGDETRACGLNLLDTRTFPERDLTVETVLTVARSSSRNWGDRMEEILRWTLYALYEANRNRKAEEQYTIYDGIMFLTNESRRREVIREGRDREEGDVSVAQWWNEIYPLLVPVNDRLALAPVLRKLGQYAGSRSARRVLGQRRTTLDIADTIRSGRVLLVNSARAQTGPEVSSIVGGAILNLLNHIAKQQGRLEPHKRRRVVIIVDEMQVFPGVPFDEMLSELRKFGGSLLMATQSLGRLNEMTESGNMGETILANPGSLFSFQVNASDAELLHRELESDVIEENDIVELPPHHCYGRLTLESGNIHFSMEVLPPMPGNRGIADLVRRASDAYTRPTADIDAENAEFMRGKYREYFGDLGDDDDARNNGR